MSHLKTSANHPKRRAFPNGLTTLLSDTCTAQTSDQKGEKAVRILCIPERILILRHLTAILPESKCLALARKLNRLQSHQQLPRDPSLKANLLSTQTVDAVRTSRLPLNMDRRVTQLPELPLPYHPTHLRLQMLLFPDCLLLSRGQRLALRQSRLQRGSALYPRR